MCIKQTIDLRNTLHYLDIPVRSKIFMFRDNRLVVDSSMILHKKIHKRNVILSFYCVREAISTKIISYYFVPGEINPSNILSKH